MPIDPRIPLLAAKGAQINLGDIMREAEQIKALQAGRERDAWQFEQDQADAVRKTNARSSLADLVLSDTAPPQGSSLSEVAANASTNVSQTTMPPQAIGSPSQPVQPDPRAQAWEQYVRNDPNGAIDYRKTMQDWTKEQFDLARDLNEGVMQILGGVYDQHSYQRGKNKARALYGRYGMRLDDLDLPEEFSPELIRSFQMEAMDTRHQLETIRRERKLDWDIEDDEIDNERADRNQGSLIANRDARLAETRRNNQARTATARRGQDLTDARSRRGQDMRGSSGGGSKGPVRVKSRAEAMKLPPGTEFRTPDGRVMRVPAR